MSGLLRGLVPRVGFVASAFTAACCLGVSVAASLASSLGATFLARDATLKPLLIAALAVTVTGSAWTARRHRSVLPLVLTIIAAFITFSALYGPLDEGIGVANAAAHGAHHEARGAMHDAMSANAGSGGSGGISARTLVWAGLVLLLAAQVWDARRGRHCAVRPAPPLAHQPYPRGNGARDTRSPGGSELIERVSCARLRMIAWRAGRCRSAERAKPT